MRLHHIDRYIRLRYLSWYSRIKYIDTSSKSEPKKIPIHTDGSIAEEDPATYEPSISKDFATDLNSATENLVEETHEKSQHDCTKHTMYLKAQAIIENQRKDISDLKSRVDEFDAANFKPANQVESVFQIQRNSEARANNEYFYEKIAPIDAIKKLKTKKVMESNLIEIGWRIVE